MYKVTHHTREQAYKLSSIASAAAQSQPTYREGKHKHLTLYTDAQVLFVLFDPKICQYVLSAKFLHLAWMTRLFG